MAAGFSGAHAETLPKDVVTEIAGISLSAMAGASDVMALMGVVVFTAVTSRRLKGSSLFNRLFVVVAITARFF